MDRMDRTDMRDMRDMRDMNLGYDVDSHYLLKVYIDPEVCDDEIISKYSTYFAEKYKEVELYKKDKDLIHHVDAGIDLFVPESKVINSGDFSIKINHGIKCAMTYCGKPTAFYLYPRSSMGSKTPLRLSNSVGIIDSGYRGNIISLVDNISTNNFNVEKGDRLVQICGPNIAYPISPLIVFDNDDLGITQRGDKGFGSTGR